MLSLCRCPPTPPHPCQPSVSTVLRPLRLLSSPRSARTACLMPPKAQGWGEERSLSHLWLGSGHWRWTVNLLKNRDSFPELLEPRSAPQPPSRMRTSVLCASMVGSCCAVTAAPKCITFPAMCQPCSASRGESCHHLAIAGLSSGPDRDPGQATAPSSLYLSWAEGQGRPLGSNATPSAAQGRVGVHPVPQPGAAGDGVRL